jgi:hypothetical protein
VIVKCSITLQFLITHCALKEPLLHVKSLGDLLLTVLPHVVNNPVGLRQSLKRTAGAYKRSIIGRVESRIVNSETLLLKKALIADLTAKGILSGMALDMVVHGILVLLHSVADTAHELTGSILLIFEHLR